MPTPLGVRSRVNVFFVALLACLALAGVSCGSDSSDDSLLARLERAVEQTGSVETLRARLEVQYVDVPGVPDEPVVTDMITTVDGSRSKGTYSEFGVEIEVLAVDQAFYYALPGLPDGAKWARLTFSELAVISGVDLAALSEQHPAEGLDRLRAAGEVTEVGTEELDGVTVTRYRAVVSTEALAELGGISDEVVEETRGLMGDSYDLEVWIDDEGYARRMEWDVDLAEAPDPPLGTPSRGQIRYVQTMSDFGAPLEVTAPPESEVVELRDLY